MAAKMADKMAAQNFLTAPFVNRFGSNLHCMGKINWLKIIIKNFQRGSQNGGQDRGSKVEFPITKQFINRFG